MVIPHPLSPTVAPPSAQLRSAVCPGSDILGLDVIKPASKSGLRLRFVSQGITGKFGARNEKD